LFWENSNALVTNFAWAAWALHHLSGSSAHSMLTIHQGIEMLRKNSDINPNFSPSITKGKYVSEGQVELWSTETRDSPRG